MLRIFGRLHKIRSGGYQLQYNTEDDRVYEVVASSSIYKRFSTIDNAMLFIKNNDIILETADVDDTVSFPCPNCDKKGHRSWTIKRESGGFLCPRCGNSYHSREIAWPKKEKIK